MGVAIAKHPEGPYIKSSANPVIMGNHAVLVYPNGTGVSAIVGKTGPEDIINSVYYAPDGLHFQKTHHSANGPVAGGMYRPEAFTDSQKGLPVSWGLEIGKKGKLPYLQRVDVHWPHTSNE